MGKDCKNDKTVCQNHTCVDCGDDTQPCCSDGKCNADNILCMDNTCVKTNGNVGDNCREDSNCNPTYKLVCTDEKKCGCDPKNAFQACSPDSVCVPDGWSPSGGNPPPSPGPSGDWLCLPKGFYCSAQAGVTDGVFQFPAKQVTSAGDCAAQCKDKGADCAAFTYDQNNVCTLFAEKVFDNMQPCSNQNQGAVSGLLAATKTQPKTSDGTSWSAGNCQGLV